MQAMMRWAAVVAAVAGIVWSLSRAESAPSMLMAPQLLARTLAIAVAAGALWLGSSQASQRAVNARELLVLALAVGLALGWWLYQAARADYEARTASRMWYYQRCKETFVGDLEPSDTTERLLSALCGDPPDQR